MLKKLILFIILSFSITYFNAQTTPTPLDVELDLYMTGLLNPVDIAFQNDTMFIVDQDGIINRAVAGEVLDDDFLNITSLVQFSGERGLLGLAFDPEFESNRTFYINYINNSSNTVLAAYKAFENELIADPNSATILLTITQPFTNHNGGQIKFGPDGYLYMGMGDGGSANDPGDRAQDPQELLGKMLRYDVSDTSYSIPEDNPFVDDSTTLDDIWAIGLRNPWRFSFDKLTGDLWIGDVGQNEYEEIDFQVASSSGGENYGWRCREGMHPFNMNGCGVASDYDDPIFEYSHGGLHCSVTGGFVYRGEDSDLLNGVYLGIDYCSGYLFGYRINADSDDQEYDFGNNGFGYTTFGEDDDGELYLARSNGNIYKVVDPCHTQFPLLIASGDSLIVENGAAYYWFVNDVELDGLNQQSIAVSDTGTYYCIVENEYGCNVKSNELNHTTVGVSENEMESIKIFPNPFSNRIFIRSASTKEAVLKLISMDGKVCWEESIVTNNEIVIPSFISKGSYIISIEDADGNTRSVYSIKE